jgi:hypothetical protein
MVKTTTNLNSNCPFVAITTPSNPVSQPNDFDYVITKPISKNNVLQALKALNLSGADFE